MIKEQIKKTHEHPIDDVSKRNWFRDNDTSETYAFDSDLLDDIPSEFSSIDEFEEYVNRVYEKLYYFGSLEEASVTGGIVGYQLPLGMGTKEKDRLTNPYKSNDDKNKKIDSDEKIRNELATTDKINYIKKHPINKKHNIFNK